MEEANWKNLTVRDKKLIESPHFVAIDLETTGFSPEKHAEIIELSALRLSSNDPSQWKKMETFVRPSTTIPKKIREMTSISQQDVGNAPEPTHLIKELYCFLGDATIIAHNAKFEEQFLNYYMQYNQFNINNDFLDTMEIFKKLYPNAKNAKLDTFISYFGVENDHWHRATSDAFVTGVAFEKLRQAYFKHLGISADDFSDWDENDYEPEIWDVYGINYWSKKPNTKAGKSRLYVRVHGTPQLDDGLTYNSKTANIYFDYKMNRWDYNGEALHVPLDFSGLEEEILKKYNKKSLRDFVPSADLKYVNQSIS